MILTKPFKGMNHTCITQGFHDRHKGWDIVSYAKPYVNGYGTPLCAPERCKIEKIVGDTYTPESHKPLAKGYGVWFTGLETGNVYVYWHTLPYLPVHGGDIVERGQIIAYMGNAGIVRSAGVDVPINERTTPPYKGTHLHVEIYKPGSSVGGFGGDRFDPALWYNLNLEPQYTVADQLRAIGVVLKKIAKLTKLS